MASEQSVKAEVENRLSVVRESIAEVDSKMTLLRKEESVYLDLLRCAEKASIPAVVEKPKAKRGRPKKVVAQAAPAVVKAKRGRPKKAKAATAVELKSTKSKRITLAAAVQQVLKATGKPMTIDEILAGASSAGHKSKAKNIKQTVYTAVHDLLNKKLIKREKKGIYSL
jgi:hypothetical protein